MTDRTTVYTGAGKRLVLTPQMHLATGGEGSVYAQGDTVYKVYLDPEKARRQRVDQKIALLQAFQHPGIAAPTGVLRDKTGAFVGLTLPRVEGDALCRLYTNTWQQANQFDTAAASRITLAMREIVSFAHANSAVMVDANELNWLVKGVVPTVIDVDSWQLPGFQASAIMASIRDPLARHSFNAESDWFAWAIVTFQIWCGIHPFKGVHPDFGRADLEARMKHGVSVFDARVRWPAATRPLERIPTRLRSWYEQVFSSSLRTAPPQDLREVTPQTAPRARVRQTSGGTVQQVRYANAGGQVLRSVGSHLIVKTPAGLALWSTSARAPLAWVTENDCLALLNGQGALMESPGTLGVIQLKGENGVFLKTETEPERLALTLRGTGFWSSANRTFIWVEGAANGLVELYLSKPGDRTVLSVERQWPVAALSSKGFSGCLVQDCLGTPFIAVPEGRGVIQLRAPALSGFRVVDAMALGKENVWVSAVHRLEGKLLRMHFRAETNQFECLESVEVEDAGFNGAMLPSGVGVALFESQLLVSRAKAVRVVQDSGVSDSVRLFSAGGALFGFDDSEIVRLTLS